MLSLDLAPYCEVNHDLSESPFANLLAPAYTRIFIGLLVICVNQEAGALVLDCPGNFDKKTEARLVNHKGGSVVRRVSDHSLVVATANGEITFDDQPPYDEPLGGVHHRFCDRAEGFVLISVQDQDRFGGALLNEATGVRTPAGEGILLSQDRRAYLSWVSPNGLDGYEWEVRAIDGGLSWSGLSYITSLANSRFWPNLSKPAWSSRGELSAVAECPYDHSVKWTVKLVRRDSKWTWSPGISKRCEELRP